MRLELRLVNRDDLGDVILLEAGCQPYPWGPNRFSDELDHKDAVVVGAYDGDGGGSVVVGFLVLRFVVGELWIFNIGADPARRRQGIGDALMTRATTTAAAMGAPLWLEVREGNTAAIRLYEKHGMVVVGRRPKYYPPLPGQTEREAALQMRTFMPLDG